MRYVTKHPEPLDKLELSPEEQDQLAERYCLELDEGLKSRQPAEDCWIDSLRQYEGVPEVAIRNTPIENAPNYEVTLGAIACDAIYAQAVDTIFNQVSPLITCRASRDDAQLKEAIMRFQRWVNHIAEFEIGLRSSSEHCALDWSQLGTGVLYCPWTQDVIQTKYYKVVDVGPKVLSHPLEDLILPAGAYDDVQQMPWVALRFWPNQSELELRATKLGWDISQCVQAGVVGYMRSRRERLARQWSKPKTTAFNLLYQIIDVYAYAPIGDEGLAHDVLLTIDYTARKLVDYRFMPYQRRPIRYARFQKRGHLPLGIGVLEMLRDYQRQLSDINNDAQLNSRLANMKLFKGKPNAVPGGVVKAYPWKVIETMEPGEFGELKVSDVYPSTYRNEANIIAYAERRVGVRELSGPSPANVMGGRTPGITAMTVVQKTSQRFAPAFDDLRFCVAGALTECCWRYREQLQLGGEEADAARKNIEMVLGEEDAKYVVDLLTSERFEESVTVEMTASSAMVNRTQDRQEIMLLGQFLLGLGDKAVQLFSIAGQPSVPEPVKIVAKQLAEKINAIVDMAVRTFDSIRDPGTFRLDVEEAVNALDNLPQQGIAGLLSMIQGMKPGQGPGGEQPPLPANGGGQPPGEPVQ